MRVVGVMLLKNEDLFVRQALTNILDFCDEILVLDNMSTDGTQEIVKDIVKAHPHVRLQIVANAHDTQRYIAGYAGTDTWVFGVDGDEIYDASALGRMRKRLENGEFKDAWCVYGSVVHCTSLSEDRRFATGFPTPPNRSMTKLFNFSLLESWLQKSERLHGLKTVFKSGHSRDALLKLYERESWEATDLRCLHVCFLKRSTLDLDKAISVTTLQGRVMEVHQRQNPQEAASQNARAVSWKVSQYASGNPVTVKATPFFNDPLYKDTRSQGTTSYAQVAEDLLAAYFLKKTERVRYIDIGCYHPIELSSTYYFYTRQGSGLCIDPNPTLGPLFARHRERDTFLNCGIALSNQALDYFEFEQPVFNTFSPQVAEQLSQSTRPGRTLVRKVPISVRPLSEALDEVSWETKFGPGVDLISIDVESLELEVLATIDFQRLQPRLIVCETVNISTSYRKNPIIDFMAAKNYRLAGFTGHDAFFVPKPS
jgi:hypothetical protein